MFLLNSGSSKEKKEYGPIYWIQKEKLKSYTFSLHNDLFNWTGSKFTILERDKFDLAENETILQEINVTDLKRKVFDTNNSLN